MTLLSALLCVAGCHDPGPQVTRAPEPTLEQLVGTPFDPAHEPPYLLCPGDKLLVRYPTDATLDQEVRIRSDGQISLAYIGDLRAAQRPPIEVAAEINEKMRPFLNDPKVAVIVMEEPGRVVFINGQVRLPGTIPLRPSQTLLQSIVEAGGATSLANAEQVLVLRTTPNDGTYVLSVNLKKVLAGQTLDLRLQPYDVVHVPETIIAQVDLFVEQYINAIIPRAAAFPFVTQLHNEPLKVIGDTNRASPGITITR